MTEKSDANKSKQRDEKRVIDETREVESETPTSSDVGKQTLTKADLGYDVTKEGVPPDDAAIVTPQHPDDPSAKEESQYNTGVKSRDES